MRWYNKERTQMVDLDKVDAWFYEPKNEEFSSHLTVLIKGNQVEFETEEADEIYNILKNQKDVI